MTRTTDSLQTQRSVSAPDHVSRGTIFDVGLNGTLPFGQLIALGFDSTQLLLER